MNYSFGGKITEDQEILVKLISAACDWSDGYKMILKKKKKLTSHER